jgi:guanylate kinase
MITTNFSYQKRLLFVVSAPSGSGKTSLCNEVVRQVPQLSFSISHTTRAARPREKHGQNYYFVSHKEFRENISQGKMAEWTEIYGNFYGTTKETIQKEFDKGFDVFFDIDERGARQLSAAYPDVITILILPPSLEVLKRRLVNRGTEGEEAVQRRLKKAKEEIKNMSWYGFVIVNDKFKDAVSKLKSIIIAERCKRDRDIIEGLLSGKNSSKK